MFQPKPIIPFLVKPIVPAWVLVIALGAQYLILNTGEQSGPECAINVQQIHLSTYSLEFKDLKEMKLKIATECNSPQSFTSVDAYIEEVIPGQKSKVLKVFNNVVKRPPATTPKYVLIEDLTVPCNGEGKANYMGRAKGEVHLRNGKIIKVSASSNKSNLINCRISAK